MATDYDVKYAEPWKTKVNIWLVPGNILRMYILVRFFGKVLGCPNLLLSTWHDMDQLEK